MRIDRSNLYLRMRVARTGGSKLPRKFFPVQLIFMGGVNLTPISNVEEEGWDQESNRGGWSEWDQRWREWDQFPW